MNNKPNAIGLLCHFITFLAEALPPRSIGTFLELLFGAMLSSTGFVTEAYLAIHPTRHWTSYYQWLQRGRWSWLHLGRQLIRLIWRFCPDTWKFLVIDDSMILRLSKKAPGSEVHFDHSHKGNRPNYVRGQCWVCLGALLGPLGQIIGVPVLARLSDRTGQRDKLTIAQLLIRAVKSLVPSNTCLLLDSWYMKGRVIRYAQRFGWTVIGQVRKDLALFGKPEPQKGRGRPRKYGHRIDPHSLPFHGLRGQFYGRYQRIWYRSCQAKARFLDGQWVRAVWCYFEKSDGSLAQPRLLISTDAQGSPCDVIMAYARRFYIEPVFDDTKNRWGWRETWQQDWQTLHRWVHLIFASYALPKLLTLCSRDALASLLGWVPWRHTAQPTAGLIRLGLSRIFRRLRIREGWDPKSRKFSLPKPLHYDALPPPWRQAA
jgi:hypothetical protein